LELEDEPDEEFRPETDPDLPEEELEARSPWMYR